MAAAAIAVQSLVPDLEDLRRQFEAIRAEAKEVLANLDDESFVRRPAPDVWSASECFHHLVLTGRSDLEVIDQGIRQGFAAGLFSSGPFQHGALGNWFVQLLEPQGPVKFRAPSRIRPAPGKRASEVMPAFWKLQGELLDRVREANGLDLALIKVPAPVPLLKLSLTQRFSLTAAHERRHLRQARNAVSCTPIR